MQFIHALPRALPRFYDEGLLSKNPALPNFALTSALPTKAATKRFGYRNCIPCTPVLPHNSAHEEASRPSSLTQSPTMTPTCFFTASSISLRLKFPQRHFLCSLHTHVTRPTCTATPSETRAPPTAPPHAPVLVDEIVSHFAGRHLPIFVDATVGAGGHALQLLSRCDIGRYIAVDKDPTALELATSRLSAHSNVTLLHGDFRNLPALLAAADVPSAPVDGLLLDVGVSSMQLDRPDRGFSFSRNGPLDMRMAAGTDGAPTAADLVNAASPETLEHIFREYGEERQARRIAAAVVQARGKAPIDTTARLADVVCSVKGWSKRGVHPATLCFQALRIAVNGELDALEEGLPRAVDLLRGGGRLAVICFHSLEDRIAKNCLRDLAETPGGVGIVNKKPIVAGEDECKRNVRSRSAKLRIVQKLEENEMPWRRKVNKYQNKCG